MNIPELILLSNYDAADYINAVYENFKSKIANGGLQFLNLPVICPWHPAYENKHFCFWHLITNKFESDKEEDRIPDIRRCERIQWIAFVIQNAYNSEEIWCWEKDVRTSRGCNKHIALYFHQEKYLVILRRKPNRLELVTAYVKENIKKVSEERAKYPDPRS